MQINAQADTVGCSLIARCAGQIFQMMLNSNKLELASLLSIYLTQGINSSPRTTLFELILCHLFVVPPLYKVSKQPYMYLSFHL